MLSIITPTYNRAKELERVYESLKKQTSKDFEWLIIDDGSVDETKIIVKGFLKNKNLNINYIYKENGGKPSAYNKGVEIAKGEVLLCLDSDDLLVEDAVKTILDDYKGIKNISEIAGLVYNCLNLTTNELIGTNLPDNVIDTYYNIYDKHQVKGDKMQVIKKEIAIKYPFPIINKEKFVPEALINNRLSLKYKFLYKDKDLKLVEYQDNGYSANYFNLVKNNPLGNRLYFQELYDYKKSLYNVYGYILFSIYGKIKFRDIIKEHKAKLKILVLYIPTFIVAKIK